MDLSEVITEVLGQNPDAPADMLATRVMTKVTKGDLFPLLLAEVERHQRSIVRVQERKAFEGFVADMAARSTEPPSESMRRLCKEAFALGNGERIAWGQATVEQHQERIAMLTKLRNGIDQTIARHYRAIELIESAGGTCLDDIDTAAA